MTKTDLSQLFLLNIEIKHLEDELRKTRFKIADYNQISGGIAKIPGKKTTRRDLYDSFIELINTEKDIERELVAALKKALEVKIRINNFINNVADSEMRLFLRLRYVFGMTWETIGFDLNYTESGVRRKYNKNINQILSFA